MPEDKLSLPFTVTQENTMEDMIAWPQHTLDHNINYTQYRIIFTSLLLAGVSLLLVVFEFAPIAVGIVWLLLSIIYYFYLKFIYFWLYKRSVRAIPAFLQKTLITFSEDSYTAISLDTESKSKYTKLIGFYETNRHFFALIGKRAAVVFPKRIFTPQQIEFLKTKIDASNNK